MKTSRRRQLGAMAALLACVLPGARAQGVDFAKTEIQTVKITDGLYVLMGGPAQGNIAVSVGSDGLFLVDSMYGPMHQKIMDALADLPVSVVVMNDLSVPLPMIVRSSVAKSSGATRSSVARGKRRDAAEFPTGRA